jgi:acetylcholinesterase
LAKTGNTFNCLREANTSEIFNGLRQSNVESPELFGFDPTIDGPSGVFPEIASELINAGHFARLPFMASTNLDEGSYSVNIKRNIFNDFSSCFRNSIYLSQPPDNGQH